MTLRGYVARPPATRLTTKAKRLTLSFPLAVHPDQETTDYYTVVAWDGLAQRIDAKGLRKGQEVEVAGYLHPVERPRRSGERRVERQVYAAALRTTLPKSGPAEKPSGSS